MLTLVLVVPSDRRCAARPGRRAIAAVFLRRCGPRVIVVFVAQHDCQTARPATLPAAFAGRGGWRGASAATRARAERVLASRQEAIGDLLEGVVVGETLVLEWLVLLVGLWRCRRERTTDHQRPVTSQAPASTHLDELVPHESIVKCDHELGLVPSCTRFARQVCHHLVFSLQLLRGSSVSAAILTLARRTRVR